ncbi:MAG: hypothetical protein ACR2QV_10915 [Gammaproteobacteria bacterium]
MLTIVAVFGLLVCLGCIVGIAATSVLMRIMDMVMSRPGILYLAVGVRLLLGVALIVAAPASLFPVLFRIFGVIAILAALALPIMGIERIRRLVAWVAALPSIALRLWLVVGFAFGAFLIYGTGITL